MEDFNEIYKKAGVLMQSALKKYAEGDAEGGDRDRTEANRLYDMAEQDVNRQYDNISQLYGENRNFGVIFKVIEGNTANLCEDKAKRRSFKNIIKLIKEDKNLKSEFEFYDTLTNPRSVVNPELYVNEALKLKPICNKKSVTKSNERLINEIRKGGLFEFIDIDDNTMDLFESIEYMLFNDPKLKNLTDYTNAKSRIVEHVTNKTEELEAQQLSEESVNIDNAVNEMVKKYEGILNNDEKDLIKTISESNDKEKLFNDVKNDTLKQIDEVLKTLNVEESKQLNEVREDINNKPFVQENVLEDIFEFIEIKNVLSEKN